METVMSDILMVATGRDEEKVQELKVIGYELSRGHFSCYKKLISSFSENCFKLSDVSFERPNCRCAKKKSSCSISTVVNVFAWIE
jgi:hypothetical protein